MYRKHLDWRASAVMAGVAILYSPRVPPTMLYDTLIRRDTVIAYEFDIPAVKLDINARLYYHS